MSDKRRPDDEPLDAETAALLAAALEPQALDATHLARLRARIIERVQAPAPVGTITLRASEGEWTDLLPGIEIKVLHRDTQNNSQTALYRLKPGAAIPPHRHATDEECLVLDGEINVGEHYLHTGDYHLAQAGHKHPRVESRVGALLLIRQQVVSAPPPAR